MGCPKCRSDKVWVEEDGPTTWLRCGCGLMKLVRKVEGGYTIIQKEPEDQIVLPKSGSKLREILMIVAAFPDIQTVEVAHIVKDTTDKVAVCLSVLEANGLLDIVEDRRGVKGGSIWTLSFAAKNLIGE